MPSCSERTSTLTSLQAPSLSRRMACWVYEGLLIFSVVFTSSLVMGAAGLLFTGTLPSPTALQGIFFLILAAYFVWFWAQGQTLAMKTWRIRVVDKHGQPVTRVRALARYALAWLWFLPPLLITNHLLLPLPEVAALSFVWIAIWSLLSRFQAQHQFLHDMLAGTRLIPTSA